MRVVKRANSLHHFGVSLNKFVQFILKSLPISPLTKKFSAGVSAGIEFKVGRSEWNDVDKWNFTITGISSIFRRSRVLSENSQFLVSAQVRGRGISPKTNIIDCGLSFRNPAKDMSNFVFNPLFAYTAETPFVIASTDFGLKFPNKEEKLSDKSFRL